MLKPVLQRGDLQISSSAGAGDDLVIAFSSIGQDPSQWPAPEFVATASGRGRRQALFVRDAGRSWGQNPDFAPALAEAFAALRPQGRVLALGLSMGGCLALLSARIVPVDHVLAFGPQWAVGPGSDETRWQPWSARLAPGAGARSAWPLPQGTEATLCHGLPEDQAQARSFPQQPGVDHLLFDGLGHSDLVPHLKRRGVLEGLVEAGLSGDRRRLLRIFASAGGVSRRRWKDAL